MQRPRLEAIALALIVALMLAGCGEKQEAGEPAAADATTTTATATVPATQPLATWVEAADDLCSSAMADQERARRELGGRQVTLGDRARLLVELAPYRAELAERLAELPAPEGEKGAAATRRLLAAAERRADASAEAGRLYERDGSRAAIAEAAAAEHDERELFVQIASGLGMVDCAEVLSADAADEVRAAIEQGLGPGDAADRCAAFGRRFLEELYGGGRDACVAAGASGYATGTVTVAEPEGMDEVFALATATVEGPDGEGKTYRVRLTYEDGGYRIDKLD